MARNVEILGVRISVWMVILSSFALALALRSSRSLIDPKVPGPAGAALSAAQVEASQFRTEAPPNPHSLKPISGELPPNLLLQLSDPDAQVRAEALKLLPALAPPGYDRVPVLTALLNDPDPEIRAAAAVQLGAMRMIASAAVPRLKQLAKADPDETVRSHARDALYNIRLYDYSPFAVER